MYGSVRAAADPHCCAHRWQRPSAADAAVAVAAVAVVGAVIQASRILVVIGDGGKKVYPKKIS